jgi:hypothetical protein
LNLTLGVVQNVLDLSAGLIKAVIYKLNITKESAPYSDYSKEALEPGLLHRELEDNVNYLLDKLHEKDGTVTTKMNKLYKKNILMEQHKELKFKSLVADLVDVLPKVEIKPLEFPVIEGEVDNHTHLVIPDMHIGLMQSNYNLEIVQEQLEYISSIVEGSENVHVHFMGDIIQSVSGLNHKDAWKNMDPNVNGAEAIIQPYKLLLEFLTSIRGLCVVNIVGGNHDRMQSSWHEDKTAEGAKLIAFMLDNSMDVPVIFDPNRVVDNEDPNMTVILLHGDKKVDNLPAKSIAWEYGDSNKFNYILTAHKHSRNQNPNDDGLNFRKEALPAFCPADNYGKTVAHPSLPGFKIISTWDNKLPTAVDIPLHYEKS